MINKTYSCSQLEFYRKFFILLSIIQTDETKRLTKSEIEVLIHFLQIKGTYKDLKFKTQEQLIVKEKLQISLENVKTILTNLTKKQYILTNKDTTKYLHPGIETLLSKAITTGDFSITFNFKIENE